VREAAEGCTQSVSKNEIKYVTRPVAYACGHAIAHLIALSYGEPFISRHQAINNSTASNATQRNDTSHQRHEGLEGKKGLKE
jgi:hypothetical protein